ncbi:carboxymuconolactone decarboxylase family protein [Paraburkholderia sp. BL25I1N1]|jgi:4-carboxymuconolactone decarboxylase|uniref:carboxymuconolactone decarboxylase family protein n=1 Tax=Paraburkholderia sp. BL25I1N1 TaxID=1938804 RepID=UPI000D055513|nr:carboxymuconolactone decarboxylase family protein [Paraburkholderia sp. BL25I1N1]PRX97615.1 4-carboxymuconolactone decarboxylase [Paraburkholderia sp. BL25I1N1]
MEDITLSERRAIGAKIRKEVLGASHTQSNATPHLFDNVFLEYTEDVCWGNVWNREGLTRATRSMLNLAMLASLGRWHEFEVHTRGAVNNGVTEQEIAEVVLQAGVYAGIPVAAEGLRRAKAVVLDLKAKAAATA